jgi:hypothetical protein
MVGTVSGGQWNTATGYSATIGGGYLNIASGTAATVPGGWNNTAAGDQSFAAGNRARAYRAGTFVWADNQNFEFDPWIHSPGGYVNSFNVRATGGIYFITAIDGSGNGTVGPYTSAGSGAWSWTSDRKSKDNFAPVDGREMLARLAALPMASWNYKSQSPLIRHLGPTAQDFRAAFQLGENDTGINSVDASGVALAAIQGLNQKVEDGRQKLEARSEELEARSKKLEAENVELKKRLERLETLLAQQTGGGQ